MKYLFPTYNEFTQFNDWYRLKTLKKPRNKKWVKALYYPFALIGLCFLYGAFFWLMRSITDAREKHYRTSDKYRKVIKEGILFDTIEYYER